MSTHRCGPEVPRDGFDRSTGRMDRERPGSWWFRGLLRRASEPRGHGSRVGEVATQLRGRAGRDSASLGNGERIAIEGRPFEVRRSVRRGGGAVTATSPLARASAGRDVAQTARSTEPRFRSRAQVDTLPLREGARRESRGVHDLWSCTALGADFAGRCGVRASSEVPDEVRGQARTRGSFGTPARRSRIATRRFIPSSRRRRRDVSDASRPRSRCGERVGNPFADVSPLRVEGAGIGPARGLATAGHVSP